MNVTSLAIENDKELIAFVVSTKDRLKEEQIQNIAQSVRYGLPEKWQNFPVFVLQGGMTLDLLTWPPKEVEEVAQ